MHWFKTANLKISRALWRVFQEKATLVYKIMVILCGLEILKSVSGSSKTAFFK
jgi:hypothetical protein